MRAAPRSRRWTPITKAFRNSASMRAQHWSAWELVSRLGRRPLSELQNPLPVSDKIPRHFGELHFFDGNVFACRTRQHAFGVVAQFSSRLKQPSVPIAG